MLPVVLHFIQEIQPLLVPICCVFAWVFITLLFWNLARATREAVAKAKHMHEVPCTDCCFFTNDHRLKCTIHPSIANTEEAINCIDHRPAQVSWYK